LYIGLLVAMAVKHLVCSVCFAASSTSAGCFPCASVENNWTSKNQVHELQKVHAQSELRDKLSFDWGCDFRSQTGTEASRVAFVGITIIALLLAWILSSRTSVIIPQPICRALHVQRAKQAHLAEQLKEARNELGKQHEELVMLRAQVKSSEDFAMSICDVGTSTGKSRYIRIQCPGVIHRDIEIELIFNGAIFYIERTEFSGMTAVKWKKQVQFPLQEGHFEFKEEAARLEYGILQVVFDNSVTPRRVFRFPQHLDVVNDSTGAGCWHIPVSCPTQSLSNDSVSGWYIDPPESKKDSADENCLLSEAIQQTKLTRTGAGFADVPLCSSNHFPCVSPEQTPSCTLRSFPTVSSKFCFSNDASSSHSSK